MSLIQFSLIISLILAVFSSSVDAAISQTHSRGSYNVELSKKIIEHRDTSSAQGVSSSGGFWFGDFTVGGSSNLSMLIDTGSADIIVNPGFYAAGKISKPLNQTFQDNYGTTSSDGTGNSQLVGNLYIEQVSFGDLTATQLIGSTNATSQLPNAGIVGFSDKRFSGFPDNSTSFFQSLCTQGQVEECRFGLALENVVRGSLVVGELDATQFDGNLTVSPIVAGWIIGGDIAVSGTVVERDALIELDSGTATIVGPVETVRNIFESIGIQSVLYNSSSGPLLTGYFPCDKPPMVGFSIPSQTNTSAATGTVSKTSTIFNIPSSVWATVNNGGNNCTSVLSGQDYSDVPGLWVVGAPFMQGRYLDFNLGEGTVGIAQLKASLTNTTTAPSQPSPTQVIPSSSGAARYFTCSFTLFILLWSFVACLL